MAGPRTQVAYEEMMHRLAVVAAQIATDLRDVSDEDLAAALATVEMADGIGPIFDPTAWMRAQADGRLESQRQLLQLTRAYLAGVRALQQRVAARAAGIPR